MCLRVISLALNKFEDYNFGSDFWDIFFTSVRPLVDRFKLEGSSSEKPSSLFSCFITMSKSPKLVSLLARQPNLVPAVFSILSVSTASDAIVSAVLEFIENLLKLDNDLDLDEREDNLAKEVLLPHVDVLVQSLHDLYKIRSEFQRWWFNFSVFSDICLPFFLVFCHFNCPLKPLLLPQKKIILSWCNTVLIG